MIRTILKMYCDDMEVASEVLVPVNEFCNENFEVSGGDVDDLESGERWSLAIAFESEEYPIEPLRRLYDSLDHSVVFHIGFVSYDLDNLEYHIWGGTNEESLEENFLSEYSRQQDFYNCLLVAECDDDDFLEEFTDYMENDLGVDVEEPFDSFDNNSVGFYFDYPTLRVIEALEEYYNTLDLNVEFKMRLIAYNVFTGSVMMWACDNETPWNGIEPCDYDCDDNEYEDGDSGDEDSLDEIEEREDSMVNRDSSEYRFNGKTYGKKVDLVYDIIRYYIQQHPNVTFEQLKEELRFQKNMDAYFKLYDDYKRELNIKGKLEFFRVRSQEDYFELADGTVFLVAKNWPATVQGRPGAFKKFIDVVLDNLGYVIEKC